MLEDFWEAAVLLEEMYALYTWLPCAWKCVIFIVIAAPPRHVARTSPRHTHLTTSLAPRHVPRTSPRPSHLATPLSQRYFYLAASPVSPSTNSLTLSSSPPLTQFLHHCTPATPQDVTARNPAVMQSIMQNKHMARGRHSGGELDGKN